MEAYSRFFVLICASNYWLSRSFIKTLRVLRIVIVRITPGKLYEYNV